MGKTILKTCMDAESKQVFCFLSSAGNHFYPDTFEKPIQYGIQ